MDVYWKQKVVVGTEKMLKVKEGNVMKIDYSYLYFLLVQTR